MQTIVRSNDRGFDEKAFLPPLYVAWKALSNAELLRKCQADERAALEELLRRYKRLIFQQAYRLTRDHDIAEDVAAATCLRICQGIGTCRDVVTLPAWIHRIVRNAWCDMQRRAPRRPMLSLDALAAHDVDRCLFAIDIQGNAAPEKYAETNERNRILDQAIAALPDGQRVIVVLCYGEGRTYEEIAERMGLPIGTVKSRLNRARLALGKRLAPQMSVLVS